MLKLRLLQFTEIFLSSSVASSLLFHLLPRLPFTLAISLGLGILAGAVAFWVWWWYDSGRGIFPEIALIAVATGVLIATWF